MNTKDNILTELLSEITSWHPKESSYLTKCKIPFSESKTGFLINYNTLQCYYYPSKRKWRLKGSKHSHYVKNIYEFVKKLKEDRIN